jgi:hypothetical protein
MPTALNFATYITDYAVKPDFGWMTSNPEVEPWGVTRARSRLLGD